MTKSTKGNHFLTEKEIGKKKKGTETHTVYLGLGTNLGNKEGNLHKAIELLEECAGKVLRVSSFLATEPWGFKSDNGFLNAAVCIETVLDPFELLDVTQYIERIMGRKEKSVGGAYHDRIIDIDILLYDSLAISSDTLTVPHPLMKERKFVMEPLREILPQENFSSFFPIVRK